MNGNVDKGCNYVPPVAAITIAVAIACLAQGRMNSPLHWHWSYGILVLWSFGYEVVLLKRLQLEAAILIAVVIVCFLHGRMNSPLQTECTLEQRFESP